jgi:tetratricopeptide (TPR) repeat protein
LNCDPEDGPQLDRLVREGSLSPSKLAELYGSTVLLGTRELIGRQGEAHLRAASSSVSLGKGDWIAARYLVLDTLQGGFGRVYICEARTGEQFVRGNRLVALKTPLPEHLMAGEAIQRFHEEASHWIALGAHPNLVLAYGLEEHQRLPFVVMEYIEGARTLHHEISMGPMPWLRVLWIALDVARGLAHAERMLGLVHGDIKPLNLLITGSGSVKIADFGLSVRPGALSSADEENLAGTLGFLAPEMYLGHPRRTTATDMYAYGVTLFLAATRRMPFPDTEPWRNGLEPPPDPRSLGAELPDPLAQLILSCLAMDPQDRPSTFNALLRDLESVHLDLLGTEAPPSTPPDAPLKADAQTNLATSLLNLGRVEEAEQAARHALKEDPGQWKALCALGNAQLRRGEARAALASFRSAHGGAPEEAIPLLNAALAARDLGDGKGAAAWLDQALLRCRDRGRYAELDPASLLLIEHLPQAEALDLMDRILEEDPSAVMTWNNRAILLRRGGRLQEALESADRALAINPTYAKAWSNRANALLELGRHAEALASAGRALELDPRLPGAYAARGTAFAQLGRLPEARTCIQNGLRLLPGDALLLRAQAMFADR